MHVAGPLREYELMRVGQSRPCPGCDLTDSRKIPYNVDCLTKVK